MAASSDHQGDSRGRLLRWHADGVGGISGNAEAGTATRLWSVTNSNMMSTNHKQTAMVGSRSRTDGEFVGASDRLRDNVPYAEWRVPEPQEVGMLVKAAKQRGVVHVLTTDFTEHLATTAPMPFSQIREIMSRSELKPEVAKALELYRNRRREYPSGIASDVWLQTAETVALADAMLDLYPPGYADEITPQRLIACGGRGACDHQDETIFGSQNGSYVVYDYSVSGVAIWFANGRHLPECFAPRNMGGVLELLDKLGIEVK